MRAYWRGDEGLIGEFALRLTGSSDLYGLSGRRPFASINFITAHDGFTLHDLVSYNNKHNDANGEDNRDGHNHNLSWNCGVEGPTDDPAIRALRALQKRNLAATLLLSQGVPMLLAGDEIGNTQGGNNNAYCQDNPIGWLDWNMSDEDRAQLEFVRRLVQLRRRHPAFRRRAFFEGRPLRGSRLKDIVWLTPEGSEMSEEEWQHNFARCVGVLLSGQAADQIDDRGRAVVDRNFVMLFSAHHDNIDFTLPPCTDHHQWLQVVDTFDPAAVERTTLFEGNAHYPLRGRSLVVLMQVTPGEIVSRLRSLNGADHAM
jgi:glycogen operon protein